ncbi:hypothetical protein BaRGS_00006694, partial [Batillaria attramentaria]
DCLQETFYAVGEDGAYAYCTVCGAGGELFVCDSAKCGRVYCIPCVEELGGPTILQKVQEAQVWPCFLCCSFTAESHGLLKPHSDWRDRLVVFFDKGHTIVVPDLDYFRTKRNIRVLSLFDGISTGRVALQKLGLDIDVYYGSETDESAVLVSKANHGSEVIHLGDVTRITKDKLSELAPIDLLVGGSPCNELSLANPVRKGFDLEGSGVLFFYFYRVLRDLRELNGSTHLFWMFENVASMKTVHRNVISDFLECQPAVWDAKHFSAQTRARFFWGNIPGMYSTPEVSAHLRQSVDLNSVLHPQFKRRANVQRLRTMTTNPNSLMQGRHQNTFPVNMEGTDDFMWISELERLFGFPPHYTDVGNLAPGKRRALLGKSWSVQVVTEILRPLTQYFTTVPDAVPATPLTERSPAAAAAVRLGNADSCIPVSDAACARSGSNETVVPVIADPSKTARTVPSEDTTLTVSGDVNVAVDDDVIVVSDDDEVVTTTSTTDVFPKATESVLEVVTMAVDTVALNSSADTASPDAVRPDTPSLIVSKILCQNPAAVNIKLEKAESDYDNMTVAIAADAALATCGEKKSETDHPTIAGSSDVASEAVKTVREDASISTDTTMPGNTIAASVSSTDDITRTDASATSEDLSDKKTALQEHETVPDSVSDTIPPRVSSANHTSARDHLYAIVTSPATTEVLGDFENSVTHGSNHISQVSTRKAFRSSVNHADYELSTDVIHGSFTDTDDEHLHSSTYKTHSSASDTFHDSDGDDHLGSDDVLLVRSSDVLCSANDTSGDTCHDCFSETFQDTTSDSLQDSASDAVIETASSSDEDTKDDLADASSPYPYTFRDLDSDTCHDTFNDTFLVTISDNLQNTAGDTVHKTATSAFSDTFQDNTSDNLHDSTSATVHKTAPSVFSDTFQDNTSDNLQVTTSDTVHKTATSAFSDTFQDNTSDNLQDTKSATVHKTTTSAFSDTYQDNTSDNLQDTKSATVHKTTTSVFSDTFQDNTSDNLQDIVSATVPKTTTSSHSAPHDTTVDILQHTISIAACDAVIETATSSGEDTKGGVADATSPGSYAFRDLDIDTCHDTFNDTFQVTISDNLQDTAGDPVHKTAPSAFKDTKYNTAEASSHSAPHVTTIDSLQHTVSDVACDSVASFLQNAASDAHVTVTRFPQNVPKGAHKTAASFHQNAASDAYETATCTLQDTASDAHETATYALQDTASDTRKTATFNSQDTASDVRETATCALQDTASDVHETATCALQDTASDTRKTAICTIQDTASDAHETATCALHDTASDIVNEDGTSFFQDSSTDILWDTTSDVDTARDIRPDTADNFHAAATDDLHGIATDQFHHDAGEINIRDICLEGVSDIATLRDSLAHHAAFHDTTHEAAHVHLHDYPHSHTTKTHPESEMSVDNFYGVINTHPTSHAIDGENVPFTRSPAQVQREEDSSTQNLTATVGPTEETFRFDKGSSSGPQTRASCPSEATLATVESVGSHTVLTTTAVATVVCANCNSTSSVQEGIYLDDSENRTAALSGTEEAAESVDELRVGTASTECLPVEENITEERLALCRLLFGSEKGDDASDDLADETIDLNLNCEAGGMDERDVRDLIDFCNDQTDEDDDFAIVGEVLKPAGSQAENRGGGSECVEPQMESSSTRVQQIITDLTAFVEYVKSELQNPYQKDNSTVDGGFTENGPSGEEPCKSQVIFSADFDGGSAESDKEPSKSQDMVSADFDGTVNGGSAESDKEPSKSQDMISADFDGTVNGGSAESDKEPSKSQDMVSADFDKTDNGSVNGGSTNTGSSDKQSHESKATGTAEYDQKDGQLETTTGETKDKLFAALCLGERGSVPQIHSTISKKVSRYMTRSQIRKLQQQTAMREVAKSTQEHDVAADQTFTVGERQKPCHESVAAADPQAERHYMPQSSSVQKENHTQQPEHAEGGASFEMSKIGLELNEHSLELNEQSSELNKESWELNEHSFEQNEHSMELNEHSVELIEHSVELIEHSVEQNEHSVEQNEHSVELNEHNVELNEHNVELNEHSVELNERSSELNKESVELNEHSVELNEQSSEFNKRYMSKCASRRKKRLRSVSTSRKRRRRVPSVPPLAGENIGVETVQLTEPEDVPCNSQNIGVETVQLTEPEDVPCNSQNIGVETVQLTEPEDVPCNSQNIGVETVQLTELEDVPCISQNIGVETVQLTEPEDVSCNSENIGVETVQVTGLQHAPLGNQDVDVEFVSQDARDSVLPSTSSDVYDEVFGVHRNTDKTFYDETFSGGFLRETQLCEPWHVKSSTNTENSAHVDLDKKKQPTIVCKDEGVGQMSVLEVHMQGSAEAREPSHAESSTNMEITERTSSKKQKAAVKCRRRRSFHGRQQQRRRRSPVAAPASLTLAEDKDREEKGLSHNGTPHGCQEAAPVAADNDTRTEKQTSLSQQDRYPASQETSGKEVSNDSPDPQTQDMNYISPANQLADVTDTREGSACDGTSNAGHRKNSEKYLPASSSERDTTDTGARPAKPARKRSRRMSTHFSTGKYKRRRIAKCKDVSASKSDIIAVELQKNGVGQARTSTGNSVDSVKYENMMLLIPDAQQPRSTSDTIAAIHVDQSQDQQTAGQEIPNLTSRNIDTTEASAIKDAENELSGKEDSTSIGVSMQPISTWSGRLRVRKKHDSDKNASNKLSTEPMCPQPPSDITASPLPSQDDNNRKHSSKEQIDVDHVNIYGPFVLDVTPAGTASSSNKPHRGYMMVAHGSSDITTLPTDEHLIPKIESQKSSGGGMSTSLSKGNFGPARKSKKCSSNNIATNFSEEENLGPARKSQKRSGSGARPLPQGYNARDITTPPPDEHLSPSRESQKRSGSGARPLPQGSNARNITAPPPEEHLGPSRKSQKRSGSGARPLPQGSNARNSTTPPPDEHLSPSRESQKRSGSGARPLPQGSNARNITAPPPEEHLGPSRKSQKRSGSGARPLPQGSNARNITTPPPDEHLSPSRESQKRSGSGARPMPQGSKVKDIPTPPPAEHLGPSRESQKSNGSRANPFLQELNARSITTHPPGTISPAEDPEKSSCRSSTMIPPEEHLSPARGSEKSRGNTAQPFPQGSNGREDCVKRKRKASQRRDKRRKRPP